MSSVEPRAKYQVHRINFRRGEDLASSSVITEPNQFGDVGTFLETFMQINVDAIKGVDDTIIGLRLVAAYNMKGTNPTATYNMKTGVRFQGSDTVRWGPTHTTSGTDNVDQVDNTDLLIHLSDFVNGDCFFIIGAWVSGGGALQVGFSNLIQPNLMAYLLVEVKS